ncbi:hypothetical protein IQ259_12775 [Fortiea sp. LEGE XX443]|uniref:hypothetical protein n=1 Tax=Fortiea sp. LEGE XX443 TaxID=1828611 RepID=UPI00187F0691|nr:hypothetical protein [Fortiea sp. LEGE XX443]MBE9005898.1 hypothetical protein [Fortiea sp. LEGE XX443]
MTTPVADKTPISVDVWRRRTDSPSLWIFAAISSVSLHLLVFWLMRSHNVFGLWFPQQSQDVVPIEFIELPSTTKSTAKSILSTTKISPKPNISSQKSVSKPLPETAQTTPKNQDAGSSILNKKEVVVAQTNTKPLVKKTVQPPQPTPTTKPEPSFTPQFTKATPTPRPTPTVPIGNRPWNRRQEVVLGQGKPLPNIIPSEQPKNSQSQIGNPAGNPSPGSTGNTSSTSTQRNPNTPQIPTDKTSPTPTRNTPEIPTEKNPSNSELAGSIVTIVPLADHEVRQLSKDLPDVLAKYQGSDTKKLTASSLNGEIGLAPAQLLASLVIDKNGNFQEAVVLEIEPLSLRGERSLYQQAIADIFRNDKFTPAQNQDGSKPDLSNLFVRITIRSVGLN